MVKKTYIISQLGKKLSMLIVIISRVRLQILLWINISNVFSFKNFLTPKYVLTQVYLNYNTYFITD
jgi:hypothetical protein